VSRGEIPVSDRIDSPRAPEPMGPYPAARRVGNLLFISGLGPRKRGETRIPGVRYDMDGMKVGRDIEVQLRSVCENLRIVLEDAGSSWDRIVDVTAFLTHLEEDFPVYNRVYAELFADVRPARTTLGITRLPSPIDVEFKVIATVD
jgi:2-aminomuconate deaminase